MLENLLIDGRIAIGAFDFDGNILAPDTPIYVLDRVNGEEIALSGHYLDKHPELTTGPEAPYRWHDDIIDSLIHFRDYHSDPRHGGPDTLKADIERALKNNALAPSFSSLKELFLIPARFFSIITSRGHGPDNLARILWIINNSLLSNDERYLQQKNIGSLYKLLEKSDNELTPDQALRYYFEKIVSYYPVSNPHVAKYLGMETEGSMSERKTLAMEHALVSIEKRLNGITALKSNALSVGFSDDSLSNILTMMKAFHHLKTKKQGRKIFFHLYFTGKKEDYVELKKVCTKTEERDNMLVIKL